MTTFLFIFFLAKIKIYVAWKLFNFSLDMFVFDIYELKDFFST